MLIFLTIDYGIVFHDKKTVIGKRYGNRQDNKENNNQNF